MHPRFAQLSALCLLAGVAQSRAEEPLATVTVTGIVHFEGTNRALLEISPRPGRPLVKPILAKGERVEGIEVREIDEQSGRVRISNGGVETVYVVENAVPELTGRTFNFKSANSAQVLETYQELSGRTVIASPGLPGANLSLKSEKLSRAGAVTMLEESLRTKGILLVPRGTKFVFAVRPAEVDRLTFIPEPPLPTPNEDIFPPGLMKFLDTDLAQALEIYQELTGRTALEVIRRTHPKISFRTQTELSRAEAIWVMTASFALADIAVVPHGEKFVFVLPGVETAQAPVIEVNPAVAQIQRKDPLPPGLIKFTQAGLEQVLPVYASLLEREPLPLDRTTPAVRLSIRSQTALTPAEAVFAFDALAAINGLKFVLEGDKQVKIIPAALARRAAP
jgi:hypothetical protein